MGATEAGQCWQKFCCQFDLTAIEDVSLDIADTTTQHIYFNVLKGDGESFTAGISDTAFEMTETNCNWWRNY